MVLCQIIIKTAVKSLQTSIKPQFLKSSRYFSVSVINCAGRKFTKKHEWVLMEENNIGKVGISAYAQEALGDIVYAQLPDIGSSFRQKDECGAVESVKAASEIYSPVSGDVTEINTALEDTPSLINTSCYDEGWLFKIKLAKTSELEELLDEKQYEEYLKNNAS